MINWEEKSNNELLSEIKVLQEEHKAQKNKIAVEWELLFTIEKKFNKAQEILLKRLKT